MARRNLMDNLPERQLDPSLATRTYVARRSGAYGGVRRTNAASTRGGSGGSGGGIPFAGSTQKVESLPTDQEQIVSGTIYLVKGAEGEDDRLVYAILKGDGTYEYREVTQREESWPAAFVGEFGVEGSSDGEFQDGIRGIAPRADDGDIYVSSGAGASSKVQRFTLNGTYVSTLATFGTGNGEVDTPWGLEHRPSSDNLYVVDSVNGRIQRFASDVWAANTTADYTGEGARGMDFATVMWGTLADTDEFVLGFDTDAGRFGATGTGPLEFDTPNGITARSGAGSLVHVWVVDSGNHRVQAISVAGFLVPSHRFTIGSFGTSKGKFNTPDSIALDSHGNIYVTDSGNHRVQVFSPEGVFRGQFGRFGSGDGEFDTPTGIAITDDYVYVCDSGNSRVQIFTNPVAPKLGEVITVSKAATSGLTNTSTTTYVTTVEIDDYTDFGVSSPDALVLPAGTWEFTAEYSQTYFATSVATWGAIGRFNGTNGASSTFQVANTNGARASFLALETGEYVSDGASTFSIRWEFVRNGTWAATPATEPGFMTVTFRRIA